MICRLALAASALLYAAGAVAIPGHPGQVISPNDSTSQLAVDAEPEPEAFQSADQVDDPAPAPARTRDFASQTDESPDRPQAGPLDDIPCLRASSDADSHGEGAAELACADSGDAQQRLSVRFGRRLASDRGILGETDGIRVDYRLTGSVTLNGVAGYPVVSSEDEFNTARQVFGLNADTGTFSRAWNLNAYLIEQQDNGRVDSTSIGGTLRYARRGRSLLLFLDYDAVTDSVSAFMASGAWQLPHKTTLSASLDVRNSPVYKRQQKYLQHSMMVTEDWKWMLPVERINHFTGNRDREVTTLGLGLSHAFSRRLKLSGDIAMLDVMDEQEADAETAASAPSSEYFYHLKLTGKDLILSGDSNKLDLRHNINPTERTSSASFNTRYAINRLWNISPRVRTDYRNNILEKSAEWVTSPALKMEYRWKEQYGFQVEAGGKWTTRDDSAADKDRSAYFISLGYQANF